MILVLEVKIIEHLCEKQMNKKAEQICECD